MVSARSMVRHPRRGGTIAAPAFNRADPSPDCRRRPRREADYSRDTTLGTSRRQPGFWTGALRPQADDERLARHDASFPVQRDHAQFPFFTQGRGQGFFAKPGGDFLARCLAIPSQRKARYRH